ncbi:MAG: diadenylate cyclase CdaA [Bacteroidales bacterium]|nr:diadenylate cyclase CdaA [Bacteroidales bacterium]
MVLELFGLVNLSFTDVLDILLVALIIYLVFRWIRDSAAMNVFFAILLIYVLMVVVDALNMKMMSKLVSTFIDVGVIALIVVFQPEIRHFLMNFGTGTTLGKRGRVLLSKLFGQKEHNMHSEVVASITEACRQMSEDKVGALIVFPQNQPLEHIVNTGDKIDAAVSERLIRNIFFKNSPLHDGAMIIRGDRIVAARCTLPITDRADIPARFGMRHKAAIGMSEESDAVVVVVSEETGGISFVKAGKVTGINNINELKLLIGNEFSLKNDPSAADFKG